MKKLDDLKKIMPAAIFIPVLVVMMCIIISLKRYVPSVYSVDAAEEISADKNSMETETSQESEAETESITDEETTAALLRNSLTTIEENAKYKDGTYYGSGTGFAGKITVKVVIENGRIASITIMDTKDGDSFIKSASGVIKSIIDGQSTNVDVVSGATYSSSGIIEAVRDALKQAVINSGASDEISIPLPSVPAGNDTAGGSSVEKTSSQTLASDENDREYKDGTYYGSGTGFAGTIKVKVIISSGKISDITIIETADGKDYIDSASALLKQIVKKQSTNVDTVSGATYSSNGLIEAVRDALKDAVIADSTSSETTKKPSDTTTSTTANQTEETTKGGRFPYKDGVYFGTGEGFRGEITAAVVIESRTIKYILITEAEDDDTFLSKAKAVINSIMSKQSTDVDTVSGATYSSNGILEAVKNALAKAKSLSGGGQDTTTPDETKKTTEKKTTGNQETTKPQETDSSVTEGKYKDGTYTVVAVCNPDSDGDFEPYDLSVKVTIKSDRVIDVTDVKGTGKGYDSYNDWYIKRAADGTAKYKGVVNSILDNGSPVADTVSGATCSSNAIIEAVKLALKQAEK